MNYYAIIVAGGSGKRMQTGIPKQFLPLNGKTVLMHTITAFYNSSYRPEIIVVLHADYHQYWAELCVQYAFHIPHKLVKGGTERFNSVKNGLAEIHEESVIAVHDAVRPVISGEIISGAYRLAEEKGTAVTAIPSKDSVRFLQGSSSEALDRNQVYLVQTPQTFRSAILKKAYQQPYQPEFTDDASVVEKSGEPVYLHPGSTQNIKITYQEDIFIAAHFLDLQASQDSGLKK